MGMMREGIDGWDTQDEIRVINFIASDEKRGTGKKAPTLEMRRAKIQTWLITADRRRWPSWIDVFQCRAHAMKKLSELQCLRKQSDTGGII